LAKQLAVEWDQLQLEQSTLATHARVEKIASDNLHMRVPEASRVQVIQLKQQLGSTRPPEISKP
jgi:cell division protein FtsL